MKPSDDVVNLFQQFGAKPGRYQELARQQEHQQSRDRWPLVMAMQGAVAGDIPSVVRRGDGAEDAHAPVAQRDTTLPATAARPETAAWAQRAPAPAIPAAPTAPVAPAHFSPVAAAPVFAAASQEPTAPAAPVAPFAAFAPTAAAPTAPAPEYRAPTTTPQPTPQPAAHAAAAPSLATRSPLAGLAGLRSSAPVAEPTAPAPSALPADLPSVFARLAGPAVAAPAPQPAAPAWQPRRGPYP